MPEQYNTLFIMHTSTHLAMGTIASTNGDQARAGNVLAATMTGLHLETVEPFMEAATTICSVESVDVTRLRESGTE